MRFHFVAGTLVAISGLLVYLLLFGLHSDLESARVQIRKESVKSLREEKKIDSQDRYAPYINKALVRQEPRPVAQIAETLTEQRPSDYSEQRSDLERNYWCRNVSVTIETNPVKCIYPDACFGCAGPIIRPEVEGALPLCADGNQSQLYHVECCPSFHHGVIECPANDSCFRAENPPSDYCSCDNRPECRLVQMGDKVQCVCIQE